MPGDAEQGSSPLQILILNNTGVGDEAALYISSCLSLGTLELAGTKFTSKQRSQRMHICHTSSYF